MNLLIINQPLNNRGDESAHKALVRSLSHRFQQSKITILFVGANPDSVEQFKVKKENVVYVNLQHQKGYGLIYPSVTRNGHYWMMHVHPTGRKILHYFKEADWVVCAPGGICMGGFQNWGHLFYLKIAKYLGKRIAYYGRSFGPFPTETYDNRCFKEISIDLLHYFSFLSIRDAKTEVLANNLGIKYISTVDTAFLDSPKVEVPLEVKEIIGDDRYVVFVPNLLIWHYAYKGRISKETVISFFTSIYNAIIRIFPNHKIIMLPQTFNYTREDDNDINFFHDLQFSIADKRLRVLSDKYSSDIQQTIISGADCMIGARYHSVVFAINNDVPFVALSYEHKISGLLEKLNKQDCMIDISHALDSNDAIRDCVINFNIILENVKKDPVVQKKAKEIAGKCFESLTKELLETNSLS